MIIPKCEYSNGFYYEFDEYISYNPKDNKRIYYRKCLSESLQKLENNENKILQATYSAKEIKSKNSKFIDLDNMLFYNIPKKPFNNLCQKGLRFEFQHQDISEHHYRYELVDKEESFPRYWNRDCLMICWNIDWNDVYCQLHKDGNIQDNTMRIKTTSGAHIFWYALKSNPKSVNVRHYLNKADETSQFGLQIELSIPMKQSVNLATLEKAIIDGTISAFHRCIPNICGTQEMSSRMGISKELFGKYLDNEDISILRKTELIEKKYGYQWNPDDHKCVFGEIILNNNITNGNCKFSGKLYTVKPKQS